MTLLAPLPLWIGDIPDDAFFYPVIARNLLEGHGFSFDGLSQTTGFHLPWLLCVTMLGVLLGKHALFGAWIALSGLLGILAAGIWAKGHREVSLLSFLLSISIVGSYGMGMETSLLLLALGLQQRAERPIFRLLGGFFVSICRVDYSIWLLASGRWGLLGGTLGLGATLLFNWQVGGSLTSSSAALKGAGSLLERISVLDPQKILRYLPLVGGLGLLLWLGQRLLQAWKREPAPLTRAEQRMGLGALHLGLMLLCNNLVGPWYYVPFAWACLDAGLPVLSRLPIPRILRGLLVLLCLLRLAPLPGPGLHSTVLLFAEGVQKNSDPEARILMEDFPGITAWFSLRQVIVADGLAGTASWKQALERGEVAMAARALGADHYAVSRRRISFLAQRPLEDRVDPPFLPYPPSPVKLRPEDRLFYTEDPGSHRLFALYRWTEDAP